MQNKTLVFLLAALLCAALSCSAFAATTTAKTEKDNKTNAAAVKPVNTAVPKAEVEFDQNVALETLWKASDDTVVGTVNGIKVTKRELLKNLWFVNGPTALQEMLTQKMIEQAAQKSNVSVTPQELQGKVEETLSRMGLSSVDQLLSQYKITKTRFMSGTKLSALAEKIMEKQIQVTDEDYAQWIKARHILIQFPQDEKDKTKQDEIAKKNIDEIAQKIKDGGDFAALADEYTTDPGNNRDGAKQGGDLGWFSKGRMLPEFESAAFALQPGEVSEPVKTFYGYHIIKLEKTGKEATAEEKADLKKQIIEKKIPTEMNTWFTELQAKSNIDNKLQGPAPKPVVQPAKPQQPAPAVNTPKPAEVKPAAKPSGPPASEKPQTPPAPAQ